MSAEQNRKSNVQPLAGRRIVVTRAPEQAAELARRLQQSGAEVLFLPLVRFLDPQDCAELDQAIRSLAQFDWIVFTSANAARFFLKRCARLSAAGPEWGPPAVHSWGETGAGREWLRGARDAKLETKIAAVGPATRAAVEAEGLQATLVPLESNGRGLAEALAPEIAGKKVLLPRSDLAGGELPGGLRAAGALVTEVVAYRTAEPENLDSTLRTALLADNPDAVTFFSPSAFHHFTRSLSQRELREVAGRTRFAAVGPVTAAAIRQAGFEAAVEASEAGSASLVAALEDYFAASCPASALNVRSEKVRR